MQFSSDLERQLNGYGLTTANACFVLGTFGETYICQPRW
ncbi:uncharacterized protein Usg [Rhizobium fabae]|uniref:Uncharacterized protein Usg n=1 Tax=Rhizobium fabae TaxID=573179 RepID=A0A7W6BCF6_9HYPH|nr:uncharacterized protein Usg [Rhizobium fabae]